MTRQEYGHSDVLIIGAGAAGMMCAMEAGRRGRSVTILERNDAPGKKIRISGGGRCNFTNLHTDAASFISANPHFCKSALARFTPNNFIAMVKRHGIAYHEKTLGQLFCDGSSQQIIDMLLQECSGTGVRIVSACSVARAVKQTLFYVETSGGNFSGHSLVIATGGISVPRMGATDFGYRLARQFDLAMTEIKPGLVPLLWGRHDRRLFEQLSGVSLPIAARCGSATFRGNILFTHRGLSGPAILQCSSYWHPGEKIIIDLLPDSEIDDTLPAGRERRIMLSNFLTGYLPQRLARRWVDTYSEDRPLSRLSNADIGDLLAGLHRWTFEPGGTEGYRKAEVTVGGISTDEFSSKTMEARRVPGLFAIGEVLDVTGHLGGFNFQWAWSSGFAAGQYV